MNEDIKEQLFRVIEETLEKLAFVFCFPDEERDNIILDSAVVAGVEFEGAMHGCLVMVVAGDVLKEMAANMLGLDDFEECTTDQQQDALKEILNIICGNFLPVMSGEEVVFNIAAPEILITPKDISAYMGGSPVCTVKIAFDSGNCDINLFLDAPIA